MLDVLIDFELIDAGERKVLAELRDTMPDNPAPNTIKNALIAYRRNKAIELGVPDISDEQFLEDWDVNIFPNVEINILFDQFFGYAVHPSGTDPESCVFEIISLTQPKPDEPVPDYQLEWVDDWRCYPWNGVLSQDLSIFEGAQRGLHSRRFPGLRFASYRESGLRHTHAVIDRWLAKYE
jgi:hypothetical protein